MLQMNNRIVKRLAMSNLLVVVEGEEVDGRGAEVSLFMHIGNQSVFEPHPLLMTEKDVQAVVKVSFSTILINHLIKSGIKQRVVHHNLQRIKMFEKLPYCEEISEIYEKTK